MKRLPSLLLLHYFRILAKIQLAKVRFLLRLSGQKLTIIGITGSAGKTSTLLATEAVLKNHFKVKTSYGSNSESGIPLNILGIKVTNYSLLAWLKYALTAPLMLLFNWGKYQVYIVEMGIDEPTEPKNMSYLLRIIHPDIGVFLNVGQVHSMQFDTTVSEDITGPKRLHQILTNIATEKARLINSLSPSKIAIVNLADPYVTASTAHTLASKLTIGSTLKILKSSSGPDGFTLTLSYQSKHYSLNLPGFALPDIYKISISASLLAGLALGLDLKTAILDLTSNISLPPSRSSLFKGISGSTVIDSSYNSSPTATTEMLSLLSAYPHPRIAILGDMRELGLQSPQAHQQLYQIAVKSADQIITVGPETTKYFGPKATKFTYWWQALAYLKKNLPPKATILVKGSQNTIFLEELVKGLLANPTDSSKLCRQTPWWLKVKSTFRSTYL